MQVLCWAIPTHFAQVIEVRHRTRHEVTSADIIGDCQFGSLLDILLGLSQCEHDCGHSAREFHLLWQLLHIRSHCGSITSGHPTKVG